MVELQVSMAIAAVLTLVLFSLLGQSTSGYSHAQRSIDTLSQARAFMHFFEREISSRLPGSPLVHISQGGGTPENSDQIAFVATVAPAEQTSTGDLNASAYYVAFTQDRGQAVSPKLFRISLDPAETQNWLDSGAPPSFPAKDPTVDEPIAYNVLEFTARPRYLDTDTGIMSDWTETSPAPPSLIILTLRFIDDSSAQRFTSAADWDRLAGNPRQNELGFIRTFQRTIQIAK